MNHKSRWLGVMIVFVLINTTVAGCGTDSTKQRGNGHDVVMAEMSAMPSQVQRAPQVVSDSYRITATHVDTGALLTLAVPVNPLVGRHDMNNMPANSQIHPHTLAAGKPQPNVDLPLLGWDWGTIPAIPSVVQTFPIQNNGNEPLLITKVVTSCGCTTASLSSSVIPPGQRADLKVVFDPNFHETVGLVTRLIWLQTNDPDLPLIEIRLDANVAP